MNISDIKWIIGFIGLVCLAIGFIVDDWKPAIAGLTAIMAAFAIGMRETLKGKE